MSSLLATWPGRIGDGPVVMAWTIARDKVDQLRAMGLAHDQAIVAAGGLRAGPVQWFVFGRDEGPDRLRAVDIEIDAEALTLLAAHPEALVVVAAVPTDARSN